MKKLGCMVLALCISLLAGCGSVPESEESGVYVQKNGSVVSVDVEDFTSDYYETEELESDIETAVAEYTEEHGRNTVKVEELSFLEGTAKLRMKYRTAADYGAMNGIEMYQGTVIDSLAAGYIYDGDFAKVEDGKVTGMATKQEIYAEQDLNVVIVRANMDISVDGEIRYVSCENVRLKDASHVSVREGYDLAADSGTAGVESTEVPADGAGEQGSPAEEGYGGPVKSEVYTFIVYK